MVKYHKKVNKESPSSLIFIVIFILSLALIIPYYPAFAAEQYDRPVIDDGGNTSGGGSTSSLDEDAQKQRESTLKKVLDKVYSLFGIDVPQIQRVVTPIPTTATTISLGLSPNPSGPIPTNQISPPLTPIAPGGDLWDRVVSIVQSRCILQFSGGLSLYGMVSATNVGCLDNLIGVINQDAIVDMTKSAKDNKFVQCVACARAMSKAMNHPYTGTGNAKQHIPNLEVGEIVGNNVSGYIYYRNDPRNYPYLVPGSLGISNDGTWGHMWYITKVDRDDNGVPISYYAFECNYGFPPNTPQNLIDKGKVGGYVRNDKLRMVNSKYLVGWQKPGDL